MQITIPQAFQACTRILDATIFGIEANTELGVQLRRREGSDLRGGEIPGTRETACGVEAGPTEKWRRRAPRREAADRSLAVAMASDRSGVVWGTGLA